MKPKVSVVIAVYGDLESLPVTLASILGQTLREIEVVLIDDGNGAEYIPLFERLQQKDTRVHVYHNERNLGLTRSLIRGCELATAPILARVDCGDLMMPAERLQIQLAILDTRPEVGLLFGGVELWDLVNRQRWRTHTEELEHQEVLRRSGGSTMGDHNTVMMRTEVYHEVGGYSPTRVVGQDTELWKRMAEGTRVHRMGQIAVLRTLKLNSISVSRSSEQVKVNIAAAKTRLSESWVEGRTALRLHGLLRVGVALGKLLVPLRLRMRIRHRRSMTYLGRIPPGSGQSLAHIAEHVGVAEWAGSSLDSQGVPSNAD